MVFKYWIWWNKKKRTTVVSSQTEQKFPNTVSKMGNHTDRKMFKILASTPKLSDWYFKTTVGTLGSKVWSVVKELQQLTLEEHVPCSKYTVHKISVNSYDNLMALTLSFPFFRWANGTTEWLSNLPTTALLWNVGSRFI